MNRELPFYVMCREDKAQFGENKYTKKAPTAISNQNDVLLCVGETQLRLYASNIISRLFCCLLLLCVYVRQGTYIYICYTALKYYSCETNTNDQILYKSMRRCAYIACGACEYFNLQGAPFSLDLSTVIVVLCQRVVLLSSPPVHTLIYSSRVYIHTYTQLVIYYQCVMLTTTI